ncbi:MAG TPA: CAP domain-containing protein [Terracidiphilus sp.]
MRAMCLLLVLGCVAAAAQESPRMMPGAAEQLLALANQARAQAGAGKLAWDAALAEAARLHCLRMAQEGPIAHRYNGEAGLADRAGKAGAHFSLIEENIAVGSSAADIHEGWMNSPGHRENLLNPRVDRVGIAVVEVRGALYAAADYGRGVEALTQTQVEAAFAALLRARGLMVESGTADARTVCMSEGKYQGNTPPSFLMRWQNSDLTQLPPALVDRLASGRYRKAAVGSCETRNVDAGFTAYRVAVLMY